MTYVEGSGDGASAKTQMQSTIPSHAAWSLVESTTFGTGGYAADVYKCDHTVSGFSADFYVMVLLNGSNLHFGIAEGYNVSTHKPIRPAMKATSSPVTLQADAGILPAGTEVDWYDGTFGGLSAAALPATFLASQPFAIAVYPDGLFLAYGYSSTRYVAYVGSYETTLGSADDPLPLIVTTSGSSLRTGYSTRHPRRGGLSAGYAGNLNGASANDNSTTIYSSNVGGDFIPIDGPGSTGPNAFDAYRSADPGAAKIAVLNSYGTTVGTGRAVNGWRRGWLKHLRFAPGGAYSDTVSIDGTTYFCAAPSPAYLWAEVDLSNG